MRLGPGAVAVITGANTGIGKQTAVGLARLGATVVMACRNLEKAAGARDEVVAATGNDDVHVISLDLADLESVRGAATTILERWDRLDALINNAGGIWRQRQTTVQGFEYTFGVNHLGHFLLTNLLLGRLEASAPSRVVNVSSVGHHFAFGGLTWDDLQHASRYRANQSYCESKLANVLFTRELARRLTGTGVTAYSCHPGAVRSEFGSSDDMGRIVGGLMKVGGLFMISPVRGAKTSVYLATSDDVDDKSGEYYVRCRPGHPSRHAVDDAASTRLWEVSEELLAAVGET